MSKPGIFSGLKVLDAASFIAAPAAATIMADFGAEVIKIEPPGTGDAFRNLSFQPGMPVSEKDYCWTVDARNKRSLALDLKRPEARKIVHDLVLGADVFITNHPPPVRRRLGIAFDQLSHLNERLIYASLTAYGEHGAEANKPGFDSTAWWARSGLMDQVRPDAQSLPARSVPGMGDHPTALALYGAIVTALFQRERTGKGAEVGSSLLANGAWANACFIQAGLDGARFIPRPPRSEALNALSNHYRCRDDRWLLLAIGVAQDPRLWPVFAETIGRPDLAEDPRFIDRPARFKNAGALLALLDELFLRARCRGLDASSRVERLCGGHGGPAGRRAPRPANARQRSDRAVERRRLHRQQPDMDRRRGKGAGYPGAANRRAQRGDLARARRRRGADR